MTHKILFVANTDMHINLCYVPYMKYLKEHNYEVHVATSTDVLFDYSDKTIKLPIHRTPFHFGNIKAIYMLKKEIEKECYDIISASTPMGGVVARLAAKSSRKRKHTKVMYTAHGFHFFKGNSFIKNKIYYGIEKWLSSYTDVLVTMNEEDFLAAKKQFKVDTRYIKGIGYHKEKLQNKLTKEEQQIFRKQLGLQADDYVIIYVAEISKRKRQEYLLRVLSKIHDSHIKVLLVGDSILKNDIHKKISKYNLEGRVKILGFRSDISSLFDIADMVISVSKQEGLPLNIMEAMYKEKPIVVSSCRGNRDLIQNGVNGVVVPIDDKQAIIDAILSLKNNLGYAKALGCANDKITKIYSIDTILPQYIKIYDELLKS